MVVVHGGPGAAGEMAPVARELARDQGILEPFQTSLSVQGQVDELRETLESRAALPVALIGFSWGAWLGYLLSALHPALVRKLILVSSGPFEERYLAQLEETRMLRFSEKQRAEWRAISGMLNDPGAKDKDALLARLGVLASAADAYDAVDGSSKSRDRVNARGDIFQRAWASAAEWRRSGTLLKLGERITCPVVALHGDYDPHPPEGVEKPLSVLLKDFRFILLKNCGHTPWLERQARTAFFEALKRELK